ncbi:AraC family transcriptional regulator, partial [Paraburkholderia sp. BR10879]|uniref:AraC family transcriptional regulator n=1 Tax=Paraburkholderia sp. BR10879 TaxID=3236990 RepID=UPI00397DB31E
MTVAAWGEIALELALATLRVVASGKDAATPATPGAAAAARVVATLRLIDETPDDAHTLASLASAAGVSEFYFLRTFSAVAGVTPHQYCCARDCAPPPCILPPTTKRRSSTLRSRAASTICRTSTRRF